MDWRKETPAVQRMTGRHLRILSLDGGGVRGFSMLIILRAFIHRAAQELEEMIMRDQGWTKAELEEHMPQFRSRPRPCDYFDLIAGTGTGGLIAIMFGRLRMNVDDCITVYTQMTKYVFETDKTIVGIPYRSTLFKASKLENAIQDCVNRFDGHEEEAFFGRDPDTPASGLPRRSTSSAWPRRNSLRLNTPSSPVSSRYTFNEPFTFKDERPHATKTAVTAVLQGTARSEGSLRLIRSYVSKSDAGLEGCRIWQAGRATCATKLAFKPITIGTLTFLDEGYGMRTMRGKPTYNPAPHILEEALKEWPDQDIGVFMSIGTGKRPSQTDHRQGEWWEGFAGGLGDFAEAKRKLIAKIEGCELTHEDMLNHHLQNDNIREKPIPIETYLRMNVDVGVGEFGMNEWNRLKEIHANTEVYLRRKNVESDLGEKAMMMAKIEFQRRIPPPTPQEPVQPLDYKKPWGEAYKPMNPIPQPTAIELPGGEMPPTYPKASIRPGPQFPQAPTYPYQQTTDPNEKFSIVSSDQFPQLVNDGQPQPPQPAQADVLPRRANTDAPRTERPPQLPRRGDDLQQGSVPPPRPPKTPIPHGAMGSVQRPFSHPASSGQNILPYPDEDGPPPVVNMARKPQYIGR